MLDVHVAGGVDVDLKADLTRLGGYKIMRELLALAVGFACHALRVGGFLRQDIEQTVPPARYRARERSAPLTVEARTRCIPARIQVCTRSRLMVLKVRAAFSVTITVSLTATVNLLYSRSVIGTWKTIPGSSGTSMPRNRLRILPSPQSGANEIPML